MVTLRNYFNVAEADYFHSLLAGHGLDPFLLGENMATLQTANSTGGIRLQVPEEQVEKAQRILTGEGFVPLPDNFVPPKTADDETPPDDPR